jgi:hypothetical protein
MCLVSVCPKGKEKFNDQVVTFIKNGMSSNKQGSGYMFKRSGENVITIDKGYFDEENLISSIRERNLGVNDELVIHHRISTSGLISGSNSHPFVISDNHDEVCAQDITINKPCLAHNGCFSRLTDYMKLQPDFSDTYAFARYILSNPNIYNIMEVDYELFKTILDPIISGSRVAILFPDKDVKLIGDFKEVDGYYHSNYGYCRSTYDYGGSSTRFPSSTGSRVGRATGHYGAYNWEGDYEDYPEPRRIHSAPDVEPSNEGFGASVQDEVDIDSPIMDESLGIMSGSISRQEHEFDSWISGKPSSSLEKEHNRIMREIKMKDALDKILGSETYADYFIGDSKVPLLCLDSSMINITDRNCKHFYFVPKAEFHEMKSKGVYVFTEMDNFNSASEVTSVRIRYKREDSFGTSHFSEKTLKLIVEYYYIPKKLFVEDYLELVELICAVPPKDIGKQTLKKLSGLLADNYNKPGDYRLLYDKVDKKFSKRSLSFFEEYLKAELKIIQDKKELIALM